MESITHALKTIFLLFLGVRYHGLLLGIPHPLWADAIFFTIYIWLLYKYYMSYKPLPVPAKDFNVCIIGAGFSGINMAVKLKEIGVKYKIIEKSSRFGGTWWDNQYPGCACDVASHLYSYSFEPNPDWSQSYSPQPEIQEYLEKVAHKYNIGKHVEFGKKVVKTTWDETNKKWTIELDNGEVLTANVLISGAGALHVPVTPDFKGKNSFKGDAFHSAHWKKGYNTAGKRVAVIGTGASSVQIVPSIAPEVKHLKVFQRTPCWVPPKDAYGHPAWLRFLFRVYPFTMFLLRNFFFWRAEFRFWAAFRMEGFFRKRVVNVLTEHTMTEVKDPEVAKKLIPSFELGCKRVTPSNEYLQSFNRDNVTLVTDGIDSLVENGIKTKDGIIHEVDTIVFATGFSPIQSANAYSAYGIDGLNDNGKTSEEVHMNGHVKQANGHVAQMNGRISLAEEWQDYPHAYKGITVPGYPNTFFLLGPGTGLGHNSVVYMIECQVAYTIDAIRNMIETDIKSVNVKKRVNTEYQEWVQDCMKNKVFNSTNCKSWYKNDKGVNYALWPSHLTHYWWITRKFDLENYICKY